MLGFEGYGYYSSRYESELNAADNANVVCSGDETDLAQCDHHTTQDCESKEAAGVFCYEDNSYDYDSSEDEDGDYLTA